MKRWISLAAAFALTGCITADGDATPGPWAGGYADGKCFRASDVTNYNVQAPHAVFVLTRRGSVFGVVAENCFQDNALTVSLAQSSLADLWLCPGDETDVNVSRWRGRARSCRARVTAPIADAAISGFRSRAG